MPWIAAGAAIGGALISKSSADSAADQQSAAAGQGIAAQQAQYDEARRLLNPYKTIGGKANKRLGFLLGLTGGKNPAVTNASKVNAHSSGTPNIMISPVYQGNKKKTKLPHNNPLTVDVVTAALIA